MLTRLQPKNESDINSSENSNHLLSVGLMLERRRRIIPENDSADYNNGISIKYMYTCSTQSIVYNRATYTYIVIIWPKYR